MTYSTGNKLASMIFFSFLLSCENNKYGPLQCQGERDVRTLEVYWKFTGNLGAVPVEWLRLHHTLLFRCAGMMVRGKKVEGRT